MISCEFILQFCARLIDEVNQLVSVCSVCNYSRLALTECSRALALGNQAFNDSWIREKNKVILMYRQAFYPQKSFQKCTLRHQI